MTNISKKSLTSPQEIDLFTQFAKAFSHKETAAILGLFEELLGREERIMIAKRFAAVLLIHHKQSPYFVAHTLNLSPTTVGLILERYDRGEYAKLVQMYTKPTPALFEIFDAIDDILHLGGLLPRYKRYNSRRRVT